MGNLPERRWNGNGVFLMTPNQTPAPAHTCPKCGGTHTQKAGALFFKGEKVQGFKCSACGYKGRAPKFSPDTESTD